MQLLRTDAAAWGRSAADRGVASTSVIAGIGTRCLPVVMRRWLVCWVRQLRKPGLLCCRISAVCCSNDRIRAAAWPASSLGAATQQVACGGHLLCIHRNAEWKPWITAAWSPGDAPGSEAQPRLVGRGLADPSSRSALACIWRSFMTICPFITGSWRQRSAPGCPELRKLKQRLDPAGTLPTL